MAAERPEGRQILARGAAVAQVGADRPRLLVVEGIDLASPADPYLTLPALATYCGHSVRWLRDRLRDENHPLPHYRPPGGRVLVRRGEFDAWLGAYRARPDADVKAIVSDVLRGLTA